MISKQTRSKIRVIVGPPGTGKTHIRIKEEYSKLYDKYGPEKWILLTHSNVARRELVDTIKSIEKVKNNEIRNIQQISQNARDYVVENHSMNNFIEKWNQVFQLASNSFYSRGT